MPDKPTDALSDAASPGKQLEALGKGVEAVAKAGEQVVTTFEKGADAASNNKNNRVVIGLLIVVIIGLAVAIVYILKNNKGIEAGKDSAKAETVQLLKDQIETLKDDNSELKEELKTEKADKKVLMNELRSKDSLAGEAATVIRRLRAGNEIKNINR